MVKEVKKTAVKEISRKFQESDLVIFSEYRGLTVGSDRELRRKLRGVNADYKVYKNTLVEKAINEYNLAGVDQVLKGPTAFIFSKDPVEPAKVVVKFAKEQKVPALKIKGGIYLKKLITADDVNALSNLPSRQELLSKLVYLLQYPISGLVNVLHGPLRKLVYGLNAVKDKKTA